MTQIQTQIIKAVQMIPYGKVVSYGQVAIFIGIPRGARMVGWILRSLEGVEFPWWRVINNTGRISIKGNRFQTPESQKELLIKENVIVKENFDIEIERYRYLYPV
jgi:methylated-DNA-protein-cysteine methyltransferase related protein